MSPANSVVNGSAPRGVTPPMPPPDPEVREQARRRRFTGDYKRRIIEQAAGCTEPGDLGALLRREGLYSSHLAKWRQQQRQEGDAGLMPKKRGRPLTPPSVTELLALRRDNERLTRKLATAELIIDVQKKVASLLGMTASSDDDRSSR